MMNWTPIWAVALFVCAMVCVGVVVLARAEVPPCTKTKTVMLYSPVFQRVLPQVICVERAR